MDEPKAQPQEAQSQQQQQQVEASEKACKEKKKKGWRYGQDNQKSSTPATGINVVKASESH